MSQPEKAPVQEKTDKTVTIYVNGRPRSVEKNMEMAFSQIVEIAFPGGQSNPNSIFTVTYAKGEDKKPQGTLVEGQSVKVKEGMVFNVCRSDKS